MGIPWGNPFFFPVSSCLERKYLSSSHCNLLFWAFAPVLMIKSLSLRIFI